MSIRKALVAAAAAVAGLVICACGSTSPTGQSASASTAGTLNLGVIQTPNSWAADDAGWYNQSPYYQAVYDSLLHATPSGQLEPWLATSWTWNSSRTVLTLQLRKGIRFTDGSTFDAQVAAQNLLRFKGGQSPQASDLAFMSAAKATAPYTLEITLSAPDPALPVYLSQDAGLMESARAFGNSDVATVPVGSGPYIYDAGASVPGTSWVFTKNPHYWAPSSVHYSRLVIKYYSTTQAALDALQGHQIDAGNSSFDASYLPRIKAAGYKATSYYLNWEGLLLDRSGQLVPALANVKVRQAINYAINKQALLKAIAYGSGQATTQIFAPSSPAYDKSLDSAYPYDPAKSRQLLAAAGYPHGFSFTLPTVGLLPDTAFALIQQQLAAVGITANLESIAPTSYLSDVLTPKWGIVWAELQQDPTPFMVDQFEAAPDATFNPFHSSAPALSGYLHSVQYAQTTAAADQAARSVNAYLVKNAWFDPWFRVQNILVTDSSTIAPVQSDNAYPYLWDIKPS